MLIKDAFTVNAPVETVWAFIHDIPRISACVPGAEAVEEVEPDVYRGKLKARVGAVKAAFDGQATVLERITPERLSASLKAEDRTLASSVTGTFTAQLTPVEASTQIDYEMKLAIRGRLATVGFTVVQQTAKKMTAEFVRSLQEALSDSSPMNSTE
jgi:carbon monoxide dehydrogenase subunit G